MHKLTLLLACGLLALSARASVALSLDPKGVAIEAGVAGRVVIPSPDYTAGGQTVKPVWTPSANGASGVIKYENGFAVTVAIDSAAGTITYDYSTSSVVPSAMLRFTTILPSSLTSGGRYSMDKGSPLVEFPFEFVDQHLVRGEATDVSFVALGGEGFSVSAPVCWQAVQDNRKWNWNVFAWVYLYDLNKVPSRRAFSFTISAVKP